MVSHLDELLSRESVHLAKHCHLKHSFVHGALIMPMGNMNFAFRFLTLFYKPEMPFRGEYWSSKD